MPHLIVTGRDGQTRRIEYRPSRALSDALHEGGYMELRALCGGCMTCATCHVYVDPRSPASRPPFGELEGIVIGGLAAPRENSRLACQLVLTAAEDGLALTIPPEG
ncbi:2Fe-2S iron-sulfur cluster-binding protein [Acidocella sp. KAb 2-4]|uniref:2Fe-2S iron-sulfur cluster-binding protein n=1 Tax=Acidocella sp. KAb 2-4 TaxID=2885158 RepID=UPI001D080389|nr:2Fe-2S iron-sulfur cluster-binding protein [Acidocella sp. KAb 2-4]MCB5945610.1 2Fe-2S iron-sulfur cluster binding domain-containing protein [Acidocella sp. KAb 2-4]